MQNRSFSTLFIVLAALMTVVVSSPGQARADGIIRTTQDRLVIEWGSAPRIAYSVETVTYPDGWMLSLEQPTPVVTHHECKTTRLPNGLYTCDLPPSTNSGIWVSHIILDPVDKTAGGCETYVRGGQHSMVCYAVIDHYEDSDRGRTENTFAGVAGTIYWVDITRQHCRKDMKEFSTCNQRIMDASESYLAEKIKSAKSDDD